MMSFSTNRGSVLGRIRGDKTLIRLADVKVSRQWAEALYQQFGRDKTFEVPDVVKALL
jgi:hypothetical protein